jgi:hypothetical protein
MQMVSRRLAASKPLCQRQPTRRQPTMLPKAVLINTHLMKQCY